MVLARDVDAAGLKILHRLVCAAVAVLELFGLKAVCKRQQLVTEADAEERFAHVHNLLEVFNDLDVIRRVAGAV